MERLSNQPSRLERINGYKNTREQLLQTKRLGGLLQTAEAIAYNAFPSFAQEVPGLAANDPKLPGVLLLGNYQGVEQTSDEYGRLLGAKSLRQKVAREIVRDIITDPEATVEITPEQRIFLKYGLQIQDVVDDLHIKWHEEVVRGPHAEEIKQKLEQPGFVENLLGPHGEYMYGLFRQDEAGDVTYTTYAKAYPDEVAKISGYIDGMVSEMQSFADNGSDESKAHIAVHNQWKKLLTLDGTAAEQKEEVRKLETVWQVVADANNPAITTQILYPIETYAAGSMVEWQYDLLLKQSEYDAINRECDDTKQQMLAYFKQDPDFQALPSLQSSLAILEPTDSTVYLRFISGTMLGFRSAASNLPNEGEVRLGHDRSDKRLANGSKINFDFVTFEQRADIAKGLLQNVFGEEKAEDVFGDTRERIPILLGRFVAGHEDAHNILEREDTETTIGKQAHIDLDEIKADMASEVVCFADNFLSHEEQTSLTKALFSEELRGLSRWAESKTDRAHLNGNMITMQLMLNTGILQKTPEGWTFDAEDPDKHALLQKGAKKVLLDLATIYESTDSATAQANTPAFKAAYLDTPSKELLSLVHDAGIMSDEAYARELEDFYPTSGRRTNAA